MSEYRDEYLQAITELCASGDQVSWSGQAFDGDSASQLIMETETQLQQYEQILPLLKDWAQLERAQKFCPEFPEKVEQLLELDGKIMSKLYYKSCYPHLDNGEEPWRTAVVTLVASIPEAGIEPEETLEALLTARIRIKEKLSSLSATVQLTCEAE